MNDKLCQTILVVNKGDSTKKILKALQVAKAVMTTVIVYRYFVEAVNELNNMVNKNKNNTNQE